MTRVSASPLIDSEIEKRRHLPIKKKEKRRHRSRTLVHGSVTWPMVIKQELKRLHLLHSYRW